MLDSSKDNILKGCTAYGNDCGIKSYMSQNNRISESTASKNREDGIALVASRSSTVELNNVSENGGSGISLVGIYSLRLEGPRISISSISDETNITWKDIAIAENRSGVLIRDLDRNESFALDSDLDQITLKNLVCEENIVSRNSISKNTAGIYLLDSRNNTVEENAINGSDIGIGLKSSNYNLLRGNSLYENSENIKDEGLMNVIEIRPPIDSDNR